MRPPTRCTRGNMTCTSSRFVTRTQYIFVTYNIFSTYVTYASSSSVGRKHFACTDRSQVLSYGYFLFFANKSDTFYMTRARPTVAVPFRFTCKHHAVISQPYLTFIFYTISIIIVPIHRLTDFEIPPTRRPYVRSFRDNNA